MIRFPDDPRIRDILKDTYRKADYSLSDGMELIELEQKCRDILTKEGPVATRRAEALAYFMANARLKFSEYELFCDGIEDTMVFEQCRWECFRDAVNALEPRRWQLDSDMWTSDCYTATTDYGHNCADWEKLFELGIPGIIALAEDYRKKTAGDEEKQVFYSSIITVYEGIRTLMRRWERRAASHPESENSTLLCRSLNNLADNPPQNLHEALTLHTIVNQLIVNVTGNVTRTLGKLDTLLLPFYRRDLENGTFTRDELYAILRYYFYQYFAYHHGSNTPFYIGGADADGNDRCTELTLPIIELYTALDINDPKIQILWHPKLPDEVKKAVLRSVAAGRNSFVFVNQPVVSAGLIKYGVKKEDAWRVGVVGCYEPLCETYEIAATCGGRVMLPKMIELALNEGTDPVSGKKMGTDTPPIESFDTFEKFYDAVKTQTAYCAGIVIDQIRFFETLYPKINSAPVFAPLLNDCMEKGCEPYNGGARYNTTSINLFGVATAADTLYAIRYFVYEKKQFTLPELYAILKNNWEGEEKLRRTARLLPKYGNGNAAVDALAKDYFEYALSTVNGKKNNRGGYFRAGAFSIDWCYEVGAKTMASADGRLSGDPLSKNMCAGVAMDKKGATALINSVTTFDYTAVPNGTVLDLTLHKTAMTGTEGIDAITALLDTYMTKGGFAIQINALDPRVLREAQEVPEKYRTLQVRRCGWNVYFCDLSRDEQNEFIAQAENAGNTGL